MKEWAKSFFGSFFSNKIANDVVSRSVWQGILSFFLAVVLLFLGSVASVFAAFPVHLKHSAEFRSFLSATFNNDDGKGVALQIHSGRADSSVANENDKVINTYKDADDKSRYSSNGYNLIIDTRATATNFNDFDVSCVKKSDQTEITYEKYKLLPSKEKDDYKLSLVYGENEIEFTADKIEKYCEYLSTYATGETLQKFHAIAKDGAVAEADYPELYRLYFNEYYPDFANYDNFGVAPTMRSFYIDKYLSTDEQGKPYDKYLIVLEDIVFASWYTDRGTLQTLSGFYSKKDITLFEPTESELYDFVVTTYNGSANVVIVNFLINYLYASMALIAAWLLIALIMSVVGWIGKKPLLRSYGKSFKTVGSFAFIASLPAIVVSFICGFFISKTACFVLSLALFCATLLTRSIVYAIYAFVKSDKAEQMPPAETPDN